MKNISIGIIGAGKVGTTAAFALMLKGYRGIFLYDINKERTRGEVMDLCDGSPGMCVIHQWDEIGKADIYVISAGRADWKENRMELLDANWSICEPMFKRIAELNPKAKVIIATNPSDELAERGRKYLKTVIASGHMLDNKRARLILGKDVRVEGTHSKRKIISKNPISREAEEQYHNHAMSIIKLKGCTQFGVASEILALVGKLSRTV
jgi:malate/lactate dehydrogenase